MNRDKFLQIRNEFRKIVATEDHTLRATWARDWFERHIGEVQVRKTHPLKLWEKNRDDKQYQDYIAKTMLHEIAEFLFREKVAVMETDIDTESYGTLEPLYSIHSMRVYVLK